MPTQFFKVTRAPEAGETTAQEIKVANGVAISGKAKSGK